MQRVARGRRRGPGGFPHRRWLGVVAQRPGDPQLVTRLLSFLYRSEQRDAWIAMLPVGGQDGTLSRRLCRTSEAHLIHRQDRHARARHRALRLRREHDARLAFSILVNNFTAPAAAIQAWIDKIALALVE